MDPLKTIEHDGRTVQIHPDEDCPSPREADCFCTMILFGKAKGYGDSHDYRSEDYTGWDDMRAALEREYPRGVVEPVYVFDHSGIALSTDAERFRQWDSAGWDWCQVGFAVVSAEGIRDNYLRQRISRKLRQRAEELIAAEVEEQGRFVSGECYYWCEVDASGEEVESCGGYVGFENVTEAAEMHLGL